MSFGTLAAEGHTKISNTWLAQKSADENAVFYCEYPDGNPDHDSTSTGRAFQPRGIMIGGDASAQGNAATVRGFLWGENEKMVDDYYLNAGTVHPLRFKRIWAMGTTARWIRILY